MIEEHLVKCHSNAPKLNVQKILCNIFSFFLLPLLKLKQGKFLSFTKRIKTKGRKNSIKM